MADFENEKQAGYDAAERSVQASFEEALKLANTLADVIKKCCDIIVGMRSDSYAELTYREVVKELVDHKPADPAIVKGAVLRKRLASGETELTLFYLDQYNEPVWGPNPKRPYGCRKRTKQLDAELTEFFGTKDLLIFD